MPTYEYECKSCGKTFEVFQSMSAEAYKKCPPEVCSKKGSVKRLISGGSGLLFKGSGFYLTDYRSDSYKAGAKADAPASAAPVADKKKEAPPAKKEQSS
jgi:putative FmdB family regulatory protein